MRSEVTIYLMTKNLGRYQHILALMYNSSDLGHMFKAYLNLEIELFHEKYHNVSVVRIILQALYPLYLQHILGVESFIAYSMSRNLHLLGRQLT